MRHTLLVGFVAAFMGRLTASDPPPRGLVTEAIVTSVYDGDTITVQPLLPAAQIRLLDCWAPEVRTRDDSEKALGIASRDHLRAALPIGSRVTLQIPTTDRLGDSLTLGRVLGRVWFDVDGDGKPENISELQVVAGHATATKGRQ